MPFLNNSWYCAGWSDNLKEQPYGLKMLNKEIVLFRNQHGDVAAVDGICRHRFAPLAKGKVVGDLIECPYHGLRYDSSGTCVLNPHGKGIIPPKTKLTSYPVVERCGAIWVWMGDHDKADDTKIPSFDFVENREQWAGLTGYLSMEANYQLVIDNLLDLTHAPYIHHGMVGTEQLGDDIKVEQWCTSENDVITSHYIYRNTPASPLFKLFCDFEVGDVYMPISLYPASMHILELSMTKPGAPKSEGVHVPSAHFLVPETETTCHYFFAMSHNVKRNEPDITRAMGEMAGRAFVDEDAPIIKACQENMGGTDFFELRPAILETDKAGILARRTLAKLIKEE